MIFVLNIEASDAIIHLFGRNNDKTPYHKIIEDFKPYFYIEDEKGDFTTIDGRKVKKIVCNHPAEVRFLRENYKETFEADIPYTERYLVDCIDKLEEEPIRVCYIDIETSMEKEIDIGRTTNPILSICCYDNFLNKYIQFAWKEKEEERKNEDYSLYVCKNEKDMLNMFVNFIRKTSPDLLTAWFGDNFDFPYLINRMRLLGLFPEKLSPLGEVMIDNDKPIIRGRSLFDMYWAYRHLIPGEKESHSLNYIAKLEVGEEKEKFSGSIDNLWKNDFEKFLSYNKKDVELLVKIDKKLGIIEYYDEIRRLSKTTFADVFMNSRIVDSYVLDYCHKNNIVLPSKKKLEHQTIEGALVIEPKKGLHENVLVGDIRSLYPSAIISLNLSPEVMKRCDSVGKCEKENLACVYEKKVCFDTTKKGIFPIILQQLFNTRQEVKKKMKQLPQDSEEYKKLYAKQYSMKVLLNSFYGVLASPKFRLYTREIADCITYFGREVNKWMQEKLKEDGYEVLAGDTDSTFVKLKENEKEKMIEEAKLIQEKINKSFEEFSKRFNLKQHILQLEVEKIYRRLFFSISGVGEKSSKKRYAGKKLYPTEEVEIVGFYAVRSDSPYISRRFQKDVFVIILEGREKDEVIEYIRKFCKEIRDKKYTPEELALPVGISKNLYSYGKEKGGSFERIGIPTQIRGALYANKFFNANIKGGDKVKYIWVLSNPPQLPKHDVITFKDVMPEGYVVDYERMVDRIAIMKVDKIFETMGWNIKEIEGQMEIDKWCK